MGMPCCLLRGGREAGEFGIGVRLTLQISPFSRLDCVAAEPVTFITVAQNAKHVGFVQQ